MDVVTNVMDTYSNGTSLLGPYLRNLTSSLLLGSVALQSLFGDSSASPGARDVKPTDSLDSFIEWEWPIALRNIICNMGPLCRDEPTIGTGVVIASPSKDDPDYFYTWTRDAGLVVKGLTEVFTQGDNPELQERIHRYIMAQARLQEVESLSGSFRDGAGLGEPKFEVNLTRFTGDWGRPQHDGPPLRAIAMITYSKWLLENGYGSDAKEKVWPVIQNDLSYVVQYWNRTGFDLWEEVEGSSFFTAISQYRALVEGGSLAESLGFSCPHCDLIAPQVLCFLQNFWSETGGYILSNINVNIDRTSKDANSLLATIHTFNPSLGCSSTTFQPCSAPALANHKAVVDSFRSIYPINHDIKPGEAIAVGRYSEDVYYGGHPWYLTTLAAAEQLYDALIVWEHQGYIEVSDLSLPFMRDFIPDINSGTYNKTETVYNDLLQKVKSYADDFLSIIATYIHPNGSLAEQFDKQTGTPLSAYDLTWSYAAFLSAVSRRRGLVPASWIAEAALPERCLATSILGLYAAAAPSPFPIPTSTAELPVQTECPDRYVVVSFEELVETRVGESVRIVGNTGVLGGWSPERGAKLSADGYTEERPLWTLTMVLEGGEEVAYKFVRVTDGNVEWEGGSDHTFIAPECTDMASVTGTWQT